MKPKTMVKIAIDILMMISLLALMSYALIGEAAHEWIGMTMFVLFVTHNVMNWAWWRNIIKGKYTPARVVQTLINVLIFIGMIVQAVTGIMMSRHIFAFIPMNIGVSYARTVHLVCAYWSFPLMSVHLGFHGSMLMGIAKRITHANKTSHVLTSTLRIVALVISIYGIYAFVHRDLGSYMLLQNQFVFFNFDEPLILFFIDYLAIVSLFVCIGHYIMLGITSWNKQVRLEL